MVLPLFLGLLAGAGAASAGSRYFSDYMDARKEEGALDRAGERFGGILDAAGAGAGSQGAGGSGILGSQGVGSQGMLGPGGIGSGLAPQGGGPSDEEQRALQAGLASAQGGQGPQGGGIMPDMTRLGLELGRGGYVDQGLGILQNERGYQVQEGAATTQFNRQLERDEIQHGYRTDEISQSQGPAWARLAFDKQQQAAQQGQLPVYEGVAVKPEMYMKFAGQDAAIDTLATVRQFADRTSAAGRLGDPETTARLRSEYQMTVLPQLQQLFQAGAMQEGELELFQKLGGDPLAYSNFSSAERGKVSAVINMLERQREQERNAYGIPYVPRTLSGSSGGGAPGGGPGPNAPGLSGG